MRNFDLDAKLASRQARWQDGRQLGSSGLLLFKCFLFLLSFLHINYKINYVRATFLQKQKKNNNNKINEKEIS